METLFAEDGCLYWDNEAEWEEVLLIVVYPEGDCDTCPWPMGDETVSSYPREKQEANLRRALCDLRETRDEFAVDKVLLPDGTVFRF